MRVLMINSFFTVGGPPRIMNGIYDTLINHGYECKIAAAREREYSPEDSIRIGGKIDLYRNAIQARLFDNEGFNAKAATHKLIKRIEQYKPDIVHLHNLHGYYINVEILFDYLKKEDISVVWTLHDCWAMTGHCCHFDYVGCNKWEIGGCQNCQQKHEYPKTDIFDSSKVNYERKRTAFNGINKLKIVTVSNWLKTIVKRSFLKEYDVEVIYNGVDTNIFKPTKSEITIKYGLSCKNIILGVAQNWGKKKGLNDFISLSKRLDDKWTIVLVGISDDIKNGLPDNIITIPQTKDIFELAQWYSAADIFLNLSYEETFGLVTAEALACGTPVIVYDRTATGEIIQDGINGYRVKAGNIDGLLCKIDDIGYINRRKCVNDYSVRIMQESYISLYKSMIGSSL